MNNQPYIYNRGKEISRTFEKASDGLDEGFQTLIDKKTNDYNLVKKSYEDIELIKKDLNIWNTDILTKKSDELLQKTASAIKIGGKLDFQQMAESKRDILALAQAKRNSEQSLRAADEVIKLMNANAGNMKDVAGTYKNIMDSLRDEKNLFSPKDAYASAMDLYGNGMDYQKIMHGRMQEQIKQGTQVYHTYLDQSGNEIEVKGFIPKGYRFDAAINKVVPLIEEKDGRKINPSEEIAKMILTPAEMPFYEKQLKGAAVMFDSLHSYITQDIDELAASGLQTKVLKDKYAIADFARKKEKTDFDIKSGTANLILKQEKQSDDKSYKSGILGVQQQKLGIEKKKLALSEKELQAKIDGKIKTESQEDSSTISFSEDGSLEFETNDGAYKIISKDGKLHELDSKGKSKPLEKAKQNSFPKDIQKSLKKMEENKDPLNLGIK